MPKARWAQTSVLVCSPRTSCASVEIVRNSPSFQRNIDHGRYSIELHAWRSAEGCTFATFIYNQALERLLRHFTGPDENEVIRQALVWCDQNS